MAGVPADENVGLPSRRQRARRLTLYNFMEWTKRK